MKSDIMRDRLLDELNNVMKAGCSKITITRKEQNITYPILMK